MKLFEFDEEEIITTGNYDPSADELNSYSLSDTRKPKLTLRHLNRLKKMRALHTLDELKRQDLLSIMYAKPDDGGGGMGGMGGGMGF